MSTRLLSVESDAVVVDPVRQEARQPNTVNSRTTHGTLPIRMVHPLWNRQTYYGIPDAEAQVLQHLRLIDDQAIQGDSSLMQRPKSQADLPRSATGYQADTRRR